MSTLEPVVLEPPRRPSWKVALFMGTLGVLFAELAAVALGFGFHSLLGAMHVEVPFDGPLMMFVLDVFGCATIVIPLAFIRGFSFPAMRARYGLSWGGISTGTFVVAAVGMFALGAEMVALSTVLERVHALPPLPHSSYRLAFFEQLRSAPMATRVILALSMGIFPGLSEELLFRGQVQRGLLANWPPVASILVTSAMFSIAHISPALILNSFAFGCWVGWIAARTDAILPGMVLHALNNSAIGLSVILPVVVAMPRIPSPSHVSSPAFLALACVALGIVALCARFLDRRLPGGTDRAVRNATRDPETAAIQ